MKNTNKKSISISGFCLILLTVLFGVTQAQTVADKRPALRTNLGLSSVLWLNDRTLADYNIQKESTLDLFAINPDQVTVTHKREIKLPVRLRNVINLALNDSGLGATDLDQTQQILWKQRFLVMHNRLYAMHEGADGTAYYGTTRQSDVESALTSVVERHINTNSSFPTFGSLFGMLGLSIRYNLINSNAQVLDRWTTGLPSARTIGYGGAGTSIVVTAAAYQLNGVSTRLVSINQNTRETTSFSGDVVEQTGKSIGGWMTIAYGADDLLYLFDHENLRILKFDTGVRGGTRGAFLGAFDLDPTKPAINSMTVDPAGNVYIGSDNGGFHIYGGDGHWKQSVEGIYQTDPNSDVPALAAGYKPYMNYYASGLNDGNGTLDVRDSTGYRQYTITAPGQTPPIRITSEPQSQTIQQSSATNLSVSANGNGEPLTYQWRKNGVTLTDGGTVSGATTANLNISSTAAGDAGYYDVLVRKPGAIVTSQAAIITVLAPTAATVSVSGRVTARGRGVSNAVVHLTSQNGEILTVRTNRLGYYTFKELAAGETYIFNVFSKRYQFDPKVINLTEDLSEIDFAAQ